uniref:Uncharacterized protein n=1 Tax=Peronospora matthiolae TaxID=2874970 RepID=A0AAV1T9L6_9STRA
MTSASELRAQNEHLTREVHALLRLNSVLEIEANELESECSALHSIGMENVETLEHELKTMDKELTSLQSQCESITEIIKKEVGGKLSPALLHTIQRVRCMTMPRQERASSSMAYTSVPKAASFTVSAADKMTLDGPTMHKDSPPILSYANAASGALRSLISATHSHYGNFRKRSSRKHNDIEVI